MHREGTLRVRTGRLRRWKACLCLLAPEHFKVFHSRGGALVEVLPLAGLEVAVEVDEPLRFQLQARGRRLDLLAADSAQRAEWVGAL